MKFYSPYQFIPFKPTRQRTPWKAIGTEQAPYIRHDRWDNNSLSGRIVCKLITVSPLVVGASQKEGVKEDKEKGQKAQPGIVDAYRDGQAIPANSLRGMIAGVVETISNSSMRVLSDKETHNYFVRKSYKKALKKMGLLIRESGRYVIYPLPLSHSKRIRYDDPAIADKQCYQHRKNQELVRANIQNSWASLADSGDEEGILYLRGHHAEMPNEDRKRETFIPWDGRLDRINPVPVQNNLVEKLDAELKARYKAEPNFPHQPKGYQREWELEGIQLVLSGDLLYFNTMDGEVTELSYSAIWRKPVGNLYDSVRSIDKNLLPWNGHRKELTPAEALFGVVENNPDPEKPARNLASRLRFYDAEANKPVPLDRNQTLKILASPTPPSPSMYFQRKSGGYISKADLDLSKRSHVPNGRKRYLAHPDWQVVKEDKFKWETQHEQDNIHQKLRCKPIPPKTVFWFHIDFENLSRDELGLLRKAITPASIFQHQLGLGKPLGLGQIDVTEVGLYLIDRKQRYSPEGLNAVRYHQCFGAAPNRLPERYAEKLNCSSNEVAPMGTIHSDFIDPDALATVCHIGDKEVYERNAKGEPIPVCYPFVGDDKYGEATGYDWFVANDKNSKQYLKRPDPTYKLRPLDSNTNHPDTSTPAALDGKELKIGGFPNKTQRSFDEPGLKNEFELQFPGISILKINMGKGLLEIEIEAKKFQELFENNEPVSFTVGDHKMTLKPHP